MSRVMEIVSDDDMETVAKRAHRALRRIGKVTQFDPSRRLEGKIDVEGYTATLKVEWAAYRDTARTQLDIAATSYDDLSQSADAAMYHFARTFKSVVPEELDKPDLVLIRKRLTRAAIYLTIIALFIGFCVWNRR